jgi:DNA-binding transcriptional LysR family regulator
MQETGFATRGMAQRLKLRVPSVSAAPSPVTLPNLADIDLRLLRVFCVVVESGGFSAAQGKLSIRQSTISTHMAELEGRLGMRLCRRGRSGFALTHHGEAVYEACQKLFAALENFRSEVSAMQGRLVGSLNIGLLDTTVTDENNRVSAAIGAFKSGAPDVQLIVVVTSPSEIARALHDGRLHVGISTAHHREPGLVYKEVYSEQALLYCGRGHSLFEAAPHRVRIDDMRGMDYVTRGYEEERQTIQKKIKARGTAIAYPLEGIATMILSGRFLGVMPIHYANTWTDQDRMRPILPDLLRNKVPFYFITKREGREPPTVKAFRRELGLAQSAPLITG